MQVEGLLKGKRRAREIPAFQLHLRKQNFTFLHWNPLWKAHVQQVLAEGLTEISSSGSMLNLLSLQRA